MMRLLSIWAFTLVAAGLTFGFHALAYGQTEPSSQTRTLNAEGLEAYAAGDFERAAALFRQAHAVEPRPELLKNQAVAWYKAEDCERAVETAHRFLKTGAVKPAEAREARALIGACKLKLAKEASDVGSNDLADQLLDEIIAMEPDASLRDRVSIVRVQIAKARAAADAQEEPEPTAPNQLQDLVALDDPQLELSEFRSDDDNSVDDSGEPSAGSSVSVDTPPPRNDTAAHVLLGVGGALVLAAGVYHGVAASWQRDFRATAAAGVDRDRYDALDRRLRTANILVPTLYAAGAVAGATGIFLLVRPSADGGGAVSLAVGGTF